MAKREYTPAQLSAIETRDKSLLVSAAAGSGKTATLTERIIRSLTDEKNPDDISKMLIVTFTNAAVDELRERITSALKERLAACPDDKRLEHQLYMLPSAKISTIDAFCNDILKNNTERFGISPRYRIADPIEARILEHTVWSTMIDAAFEGLLPEIATAEEFEELASSLTGVKTDAQLEEAFELLYDKSKSHERGVQVFSEMREKLLKTKDEKLEDVSYVSYAMKRAHELGRHYAAIVKKMAIDVHGGEFGMEEHVQSVRDIAARRDEVKKQYRAKKKDAMLAEIGDTLPEEKYLAVMWEDLQKLSAIDSAETYAAMRDAFGIKFDSMPRISESDKTPEMIEFSALREAMKDDVTKCAARYFSYTEEDWRAHLDDLARLVGVIDRFIVRFDGIYFAEKKKRAMLEYSDIERLTYESLYNPDGTLTDLAEAEREKYSSVYIDEYQDVNTLQNKIFLAVSRSDNRFTVGDIKQSIYGFRSARPDIFADMKRSYPPLKESDGSDTASIFMSQNFRCDRGIINFVNDIFDEMFALTAESIGYVSEDRLECAKKYDGIPEPALRAPEVMLFSKEDANEDGNEDAELDEDMNSSDLPPLWVAAKVRELLDGATLNSGERVRPKDIAVILRKDGGRALLYKEALSNLGISVRAPENKNFFLNSEIQLALCLLNAINNPLKDIYLAGLMLSPLYSFTPSELHTARSARGSSLWESVTKYSAAHPEEEKFRDFITALNRYRRISEGMNVDALILKLYNETGLLALGLGSGCKENLMLLYNYARKFEASSYEGLYSFINYVNTVISSGASFASNKEESDEDAVTIMTVHKSKGLEFPIVILADASTSLVSRNERSAKIAYSEEMGIGFKTRIKGGLAMVESPVHNVIIDRNVERSIEEELRVYYVALTRARERLFIVGAPQAKTKDGYVSAAEFRKKHKTKYILRQIKTFVDILYAANTSAVISWQEDRSEVEDEAIDTGAPSTPDIQEDITCTDISDSPSVKKEKEKHTKLDTEESLYGELLRRFGYKYHAPHLTTLPEKMSISSLSPSVLDGTDEEERLTIDARPSKRKRLGRVPEFISGREEDESARRGIATHNVLQFMDLERFGRVGAKEELSALVRDGFISKENGERVYIDEIEAFERSELYRNMRSAKSVLRELRFSVMLPAALFTEVPEKQKAYENERILLQGVIDCIYEDASGEYHLIDYKTDRLTKEEIQDKTLAQRKLSRKHSLQLTYYALAIREMLGKLPKTIRVYSLPLGDTVDVEFLKSAAN